MEIEPFMFTDYFGQKDKLKTSSTDHSTASSGPRQRKNKARKRHEQPPTLQVTHNAVSDTHDSMIPRKDISMGELDNTLDLELKHPDISSDVRTDGDEDVSDGVVPDRLYISKDLGKYASGKIMCEEDGKNDLRYPKYGLASHQRSVAQKGDKKVRNISGVRWQREKLKNSVPAEIPFQMIAMSIIFLFTVLAVRLYTVRSVAHLCGWVVVSCLGLWSQHIRSMHVYGVD